MTELTRIPRVWDPSFKAVFADDTGRGGRCVVLQCIHCTANISPSNPAGNTRDHLKRCPVVNKPRRSPRGHDGSKRSSALSDDADDDDADEDEGARVRRKLSHQLSIDNFAVAPAQQAQFLKQLALFLITSETPFGRANNQHLHKAIGILGGKVPDESVFRQRLTPELYAETKELVMAEMEKLLGEVRAFQNADLQCCLIHLSVGPSLIYL